ncbi:putative LYR motif-containing protein 5 [Hypsibius exemplaris]|uniref:LYR motif-containing protein 5 n=1 Tax=Hypsibius exemplaris TaxID=2072580 RepID=A0A9X6RM56_HYPEX|nr:putative LYR motif-containing protein 5 [Hypsibius exemplaris]
MSALRARVIELYKQLYYMGKEYPAGAEWFHPRLKKAFLKNKDVSDPKEIEALIGRGQFVIKEIEALYMLRKYRSLKKSYYEEPLPLAEANLVKKINANAP